MGLTIHYKLKQAAQKTSARPVLELLRQAALDLPFAEVGELVELKADQCDYQKREQGDPNRWLLIQADGSVSLGGHSSLSVAPTHLIAFSTWPGEGCEEANFGLCRYPATIGLVKYGGLRQRQPSVRLSWWFRVKELVKRLYYCIAGS